MAYEKQNFVDWEYDANGNVVKQGTTLRKAHLDHIEDGIAKSISYEAQNLTVEQKRQARANIGAASADYETENLEFDTYATAECDPITGEYTPSTAVKSSSVRKLSTLSGGRSYINWDTNKLSAGLGVRAWLFNSDNELCKVFCGYNGISLNPYYNETESGYVGDLGEDAWLDIGTQASMTYPKAPFSLPVPEGYYIRWELFVATNGFASSDGTLTKDWSAEAEANNTWVYTWIKTGIETYVTKEAKTVDSFVSYEEQELSAEQKAQARANIGAANARVIETENLEFDTYVTEELNPTTGEYTPSTSVTGYSIKKLSTLSGGRAYIGWNTNKLTGIGVRAWLFNSDGELCKVFCGYNGTILNPYYNDSETGYVGDLGEDAWLDIGTDARYTYPKTPFSLPVPEGYYIRWDFMLASSGLGFPDGTLTKDWSAEAEANNTWVYTWIKTGIETSITAEKNADGLLSFRPQTLTAEQKKQARKNIGVTDVPFVYEECKLPVLYLSGDVSEMTKDNAVTLDYVYGDLSGTCTVKWQGSSSLSYPKKNYTIKFDEAFEAVEGWGAQKKYCFKANFIDHSHARNVVSCKLWGRIVKSRDVENAMLSLLPNGGAIDGFPVIISLNGEFHGLYTFNIPKDGWMFGMGNGTQEAIVCADAWVEATGFKAAATLDGDFELEYVTDEDNADWVLASLNRLINACINSDGTDLDTTVAQYLDWDSAIDYYIHAVLEGASDATNKNYLLATYDGVKWFFSNYDRDTTYGLYWDGKSFVAANSHPTFVGYASQNRVMELIRTYKKDALKARYAELRNSAMSEINVATVFENFTAAIPKPVLLEDCKKWPTIPSSSVSNLNQILNWYRLRIAVIDKEVEAL
jgi:hypothetical protein